MGLMITVPYLYGSANGTAVIQVYPISIRLVHVCAQFSSGRDHNRSGPGTLSHGVRQARSVVSVANIADISTQYNI